MLSFPEVNQAQLPLELLAKLLFLTDARLQEVLVLRFYLVQQDILVLLITFVRNLHLLPILKLSLNHFEVEFVLVLQRGLQMQPSELLLLAMVVDRSFLVVLVLLQESHMLAPRGLRAFSILPLRLREIAHN